MCAYKKSLLSRKYLVKPFLTTKNIFFLQCENMNSVPFWERKQCWAIVFGVPWQGIPRASVHVDCPGNFYESSPLMNRVEKKIVPLETCKIRIALYLQSFWEGLQLIENFRHVYTKRQIQAFAWIVMDCSSALKAIRISYRKIGWWGTCRRECYSWDFIWFFFPW